MLVVLTLAAVMFVTQLKRAVTSSGADIPDYGSVVNFTLTNQHGEVVSLSDLKGKVWIADIIFTRCPGPCARMTRQMKELQDSLPATGDLKLVSLTTDPDFDTPPVLRQYAERFGADTNRWMFLTGSKAQLGRAAIDGLKLAAVEKKPEERESADDLFIHSTIFVVVDRQGKLRGIFETGGEGVDWNKSKLELLGLVKTLERER